MKMENEKMKKKIEDFQKENEQMKIENEQMKKKVETFQKENEQMKKENEQMKKENEQMKGKMDKMFNSNKLIKMELDIIKKEMKSINYRDVSKIIINNYINKYQKELNANKGIKTKKEKAFYISKLLIGNEARYYAKMINKYYNSNINSHIAIIFDEYGKKCIIGSSFDENHVIQKVSEDYYMQIFEEKIQDKNIIESLFNIQEIIRQLYQNYRLNIK